MTMNCSNQKCVILDFSLSLISYIQHFGNSASYAFTPLYLYFYPSGPRHVISCLDWSHGLLPRFSDSILTALLSTFCAFTREIFTKLNSCFVIPLLKTFQWFLLLLEWNSNASPRFVSTTLSDLPDLCFSRLLALSAPFLFLLNLLGWPWLIKLYRFQVYSSIIYQLYIVLCLPSKVNLLPLPYSLPCTFFYLLHNPLSLW